MADIPTGRSRKAAARRSEQEQPGPAEKPSVRRLDEVDAGNKPPADGRAMKDPRTGMDNAMEAAQLATFSWDSGSDRVVMDQTMVELLHQTTRPVPANLLQLLSSVHDDDRAALRAQLRACAEHQTGFFARFRLMDDSGEFSWIDCSGKPVSLSTNEHAHVLCICRLTQVDVEKELQKSDERRLARAAHEIRTPVAGIVGLARLLEQDSNLTDTQRKRLGLMVDNGNDLLETLNDILKRARQSQEGNTRHQPVRLSTFLSDLVEMFKAMQHSSGVVLQHCLDSKDLEFRSDRVRLRRILTNLMGNALKFTDQGSVSLRASWEYSGSHGTVDLRVQVIDTGAGIDPASLQRIFRPYEQLALGRAKKGNGLGLSISRDLARQLGGKISVESIPGRGSTFTLTVPVAVVASEQQNVATQAPMVILIGSDRVSNQQRVHKLQAAGFRTRWHAKVNPGDIPYFHSHMGPVIVDCSDLHVGLRNLDWIRTSIPEANDNVIAVCGPVTERQASGLLRAGASTLLTWPFSDDDLEAAVAGSGPRPSRRSPTVPQQATPACGGQPGSADNCPQPPPDNPPDNPPDDPPDDLEGLIDQLESVGKSLSLDPEADINMDDKPVNWKNKLN